MLEKQIRCFFSSFCALKIVKWMPPRQADARSHRLNECGDRKAQRNGSQADVSKASSDKKPIHDGINAGKGRDKDGWDHIGKEGFRF